LLEKTNKTENYKFIVTAGNDTPGFLYALTKLIAEADVDILSTNIYTYPRHNGDSPHVEDTFILGPRNIDQLRKIIAEK
jgi:UTP:GlnB (protein PII) uridylyltransferase